MEKYAQTKDKASLRAVCILSLIPISVIVVSIVAWRPLLPSRVIRYTKLIISEVINNDQRYLDNKLQFAAKEWRLFEIESRFGQDWCNESVGPRSDVAWLTVAVNDDFIVPALVLGHSIRTFSCHNSMIVFISEEVSETAVKALQSVGWETRLVEEMDCNWLDGKVGGDRNSGLLGRPRGHRIRGTHTRFHAWKYTEVV